MDGAPACNTHPDLVAFKRPLLHFADSITRRRKTRIVAIGSSSTAGVDEILPFPCRLELLLRQSKVLHGRMIDVVNRGIGGQEAPEELSRFECDVIAEQPSLVIWQVGTNAIFHKDSYNFDAVEATIARRTGLARRASDRCDPDRSAIYGGAGQRMRHGPETQLCGGGQGSGRD